MSTDTRTPGGGAAGATAGATGGSATGSGSGSMLEMYSMYQQTQTQVFVAALDELFVITAVVTLLGVVLAAFLRHGPAPAAPPAAPSAAPAVAAESAAPSELAEPEPSSNGQGHVPGEDPVHRNGRAASPTREDESVGS